MLGSRSIDSRRRDWRYVGGEKVVLSRSNRPGEKRGVELGDGWPPCKSFSCKMANRGFFLGKQKKQFWLASPWWALLHFLITYLSAGEGLGRLESETSGVGQCFHLPHH